MTLNEIFIKLWDDYVELNPQAREILKLFIDQGEEVINDHIALRTFAHPLTSIDAVAELFVEAGYSPQESYTFPDKKLTAKHYEHSDKKLPKVFISQLELESFSRKFQSIVKNLINASSDKIDREALVYGGKLWEPIYYTTYNTLRAESEYAAWLYAFGFRANHFTIKVNELELFQTLEDVNKFIENNGFELNSSGGKIKGSKSTYLEQSSTLADEVSVDFVEGARQIPACFYEFAKRYKLPTGEEFNGFVAQNADKIFESTDHK